MGIYNVQDAQIHLSRLLDQAVQGEEVIIAKDGRPIAKLVRVSVEPRQPGRLKGCIRIGPDFDEPLPEGILAAFNPTDRPYLPDILTLRLVVPHREA